jgi:hypothetical protein|tara:strand:- start:316 stop:768 length:453 start_codon:yes stop_codon:yes gene_type:complete
MAVLEGKAYWASVTSPNTTFEPVYTVDLVVDNEVANDFEARGFKIKDLSVKDENGGATSVGRALTIKRKVNGPNGMVRNAPKLFDKEKNTMDDVVGNGSHVKVQYNEWETDNKYGQFKGLDFQAMQVIDLVALKTQDGAELNPFGDGEEF